MFVPAKKREQEVVIVGGELEEGSVISILETTATDGETYAIGAVIEAALNRFTIQFEDRMPQQ